MVFQVLNKLKWNGGLERCEIVILHRGAPGNRKTIKGSQLAGFDRHYFYLRNDRDTMIPLHRIREVILDGNLIWKRKKQPKDKD